MIWIRLIPKTDFYMVTVINGGIEKRNPKRLVSYDHSNPNNDRKSPCKYIEVDNNIFLLDEAYIVLVL